MRKEKICVRATSTLLFLYCLAVNTFLSSISLEQLAFMTNSRAPKNTMPFVYIVVVSTTNLQAMQDIYLHVRDL